MDRSVCPICAAPQAGIPNCPEHNPSISQQLAATARFRAQEQEDGGKTVVRSIWWMSEPLAEGFRILAVSVNADERGVDTRTWKVDRIGDAFGLVAEWKREIQLRQSVHSIIIKRIV